MVLDFTLLTDEAELPGDFTRRLLGFAAALPGPLKHMLIYTMNLRNFG